MNTEKNTQNIPEKQQKLEKQHLLHHHPQLKSALPKGEKI